jgi:Protein of unknown function (DUF1415)
MINMSRWVESSLLSVHILNLNLPSLMYNIGLTSSSPPMQCDAFQARTGEEMGAANFARRSPWPMINILRTPQVRAAQKGIPTGQVYKQNEERLSAVGTSTLEVSVQRIR